MAVVPVCYKLPYKVHVFPPQNSLSHQQRGFVCVCSLFPKRFISSVARKPSAADIFWLKAKIADRVHASKGDAILDQTTLHFHNLTQSPFLPNLWNIEKENLGTELCTSTIEKQLGLLDSYFGQLHDDADKPSSESSDEVAETVNESKQISTVEELESLNSYLVEINKEQSSASMDSYSDKRGDEDKVTRFIKSRNKNVNGNLSTLQTLDQNDETTNLYLIGLLASINIAVFLFEIASPVRNSDFELYSLPLLYGAKINDLILVGEWWRLVTPMFLHSGVLHVSLGCWSLVTFGPQVCRGYGSFTFFLIYILGGISGNLTSFLHTSQPTVGGTGPIFAIIGAWLVYQMQNKDVIGKDVVDNMYQKAIIITGISFILSHFGPIDDWTHLGAVLTGVVYGYLTCPSLQMDNASSSRTQEEGIALFKQYGSPCKSLAVFAVCILFLSSLLVFFEPPLNTFPDELDSLALLF